MTLRKGDHSKANVIFVNIAGRDFTAFTPRRMRMTACAHNCDFVENFKNVDFIDGKLATLANRERLALSGL